MSSLNSNLAFPLIVFLKFCFIATALCDSAEKDSLKKSQDTLYVQQHLYYGRVWRDLYSRSVTGDEYLYSRDFLSGNVTFNSRPFTNLKLRYDIYNDEIMILTYQGNVLGLNKEMVDNFEIEYADVIHKFKKLEADSLEILRGYVEILYNGKTSLYTKHSKVISRFAEGKPYDSFEEATRIYLSKEGRTYRLNSKKELISLLNEKQEQIRKFIRSNKLKVTKKVPESFIPVLKFYDSISP